MIYLPIKYCFIIHFYYIITFHLKEFKNNLLVTTPILLWLTEPHLYFGFFTEAFTFTLSPTLIGCRLGLEGGNPRSSMWMNRTQYVLPLCCQSTYKMMLYYSHCCFWRDSLPVGQGLLIHEVSRSHTMTHHSRQNSSG